jgi:hypothetical protein
MATIRGVDGLATVLAASPALAVRLVAEHTDRGDGRCRTCRLGNEAGNHRWPCTIYAAATRATEMIGYSAEAPP